MFFYVNVLMQCKLHLYKLIHTHTHTQRQSKADGMTGIALCVLARSLYVSGGSVSHHHLSHGGRKKEVGGTCRGDRHSCEVTHPVGGTFVSQWWQKGEPNALITHLSFLFSLVSVCLCEIINAKREEKGVKAKEIRDVYSQVIVCFE